ncbi:hypothetical protein H9Y04_45410 [Streptomyces sp. TRM66268-LWL]|uniref:Uncharacterized protein n=1 Tax=Streptomyces polyasparticus TaxID=2767826 RepID=A0ABR7SXM2_9ACTN|nr:hypothetical protein [Streptomyces polyasparticus]MBC9719717.1 hypothetical protein [Streptomyces polyasparticus]
MRFTVTTGQRTIDLRCPDVSLAELEATALRLIAATGHDRPDHTSGFGFAPGCHLERSEQPYALCEAEVSHD